jgi:hypothetical protein
MIQRNHPDMTAWVRPVEVTLRCLSLQQRGFREDGLRRPRPPKGRSQMPPCRIPRRSDAALLSTPSLVVVGAPLWNQVAAVAGGAGQPSKTNGCTVRVSCQ